MGAGDRGRPVGILTVKVVNARNLKNKELVSKSDPYCRVGDTTLCAFFIQIIS